MLNIFIGVIFICSRIKEKGKETDVDTEKKKLYKVLNKVNRLSKHQVGISRACVGSLLGCMVFDAVPCPYWAAWIEKLFTYNMGNVIAIIVLVWTFTVSLSTYCLEKLGTRYYGILMSDVLSFDLKAKRLTALAIMVLAELFSLIFAAILEWEITIAMVAVQQFLIMIYLFLLVCAKTSYQYILQQIKAEMEAYTKMDLIELVKQIEEIKNEKSSAANEPMLFKMVKNLDYSDLYSKEELLEVLKVSSNALSKMLLKIETSKPSLCEDEMFEFQRCMIVFSEQIALDIIQAAKTKDNILNILYKWMGLDNIRLEIKQGIISALFEELTPCNVSIYQNLIKAEKKYQEELQIWSAVYNAYVQEHMGEEWRTIYTERQFKELKKIKRLNTERQQKGKVEETALMYWRYICESNGTYAPLFKYIF